MPDEREPHQIYLAEFPDAPAAINPEETSAESHKLCFVDHDAANEHTMATRRALASAHARRKSGANSTGRRLTEISTLEDLATAWADPTKVDDDGLDALFSIANDTDRSHIHRGLDRSGNPLYAIPATLHYSWSGSSADCSIDSPVSLKVPANILASNTGLVRHPDRPDWYDTSGRHTISYRWAQRPTGTIHTFVVQEDWLDRRLQELGFALVIGLFGERQQVTTEPTHWGTFSHVATRAAGHRWSYATPTGAVQRSRR